MSTNTQNGIRLQIAAIVLSVLQTIVIAMGAYILMDIHDRVVRLENLNLGGKDEKTRPVFPIVDPAQLTNKRH